MSGAADDLCADGSRRFGCSPRSRCPLVYNALNASNVVTLNTNYGPSWLQPTSFLTGRLYEIGMQWSF